MIIDYVHCTVNNYSQLVAKFKNSSFNQRDNKCSPVVEHSILMLGHGKMTTTYIVLVTCFYKHTPHTLVYGVCMRSGPPTVRPNSTQFACILVCLRFYLPTFFFLILFFAPLSGVSGGVI